MNSKKTILLVFLFWGFGHSLYAQLYVKRRNISEMKEVSYIELIMDRRLFSRQLSFAVIDYGQAVQGPNRNHRITDAEGNDLLFKGEMDIFNYLYKMGWIHETTYVKDDIAFHIFRRKGVPE